MSAIASFIQIPKAALERVRDDYPDYLQKNGRSVSEYEWSGYVLATLLIYLQQHHIDLMHSQYDELSTFLTNEQGATHFIFTAAHKKAYLEKLSLAFSKEELRDYYNEFNATNEDEAGEPMLDGIRSLHRCLNAIDDESVVVFSID